MEEKSRNMTDEHLSRQLRKSKSGKLGGKLLSLVGGVVAIAGIILGGNIVLVVIGGQAYQVVSPRSTRAQESHPLQP